MNVSLSTSTRDADRIAIEGYFDGSKVNFTDGAHDGDYYITEVVPDDNKQRFPAEHRLRITIIEA